MPPAKRKNSGNNVEAARPQVKAARAICARSSGSHRKRALAACRELRGSNESHGTRDPLRVSGRPTVCIVCAAPWDAWPARRGSTALVLSSRCLDANSSCLDANSSCARRIQVSLAVVMRLWWQGEGRDNSIRWANAKVRAEWPRAAMLPRGGQEPPRLQHARTRAVTAAAATAAAACEDFGLNPSNASDVQRDWLDALICSALLEEWYESPHAGTLWGG